MQLVIWQCGGKFINPEVCAIVVVVFSFFFTVCLALHEELGAGSVTAANVDRCVCVCVCIADGR